MAIGFGVCADGEAGRGFFGHLTLAGSRISLQAPSCLRGCEAQCGGIAKGRLLAYYGAFPFSGNLV